jgi:hypothetical protein
MAGGGMQKKSFSTFGVQTPLVLVIVLFTQQILVKPVLAASPKKHKTTPTASKKKTETPTVQARTTSSVKTAKQQSAGKSVATTTVAKSEGKTIAKSVIVSSAQKRKARTTTKSRVVATKRRTGVSKRAAKRHTAARQLAVQSFRKGRHITSSESVSFSPKAIKVVPPFTERPEINFSPQRAAIALKLNAEWLPYRVNSVFVLPEDELFLEVMEPHKKHEYTLRSPLGEPRHLGLNRWYWLAPRETGIYPVEIQRAKGEGIVTLNVLVMVPAYQMDGEYLNGYRIGHYPSMPLGDLSIYTPPRGFIEVTQENEHTLVSPHFRLGQFLCKQDGNYPKYMVLDHHLLVALEYLLEKANDRGYACQTLTIMSGYRTPHYNRAIGNRTSYSRHLWGDAADIFIDEFPRDGQMDDLNRDGAVDADDAAVLYDLIEHEYEPRFQRILTGGLAQYRETGSHGPFVHVDVRGIYARWGRNRARGFTPAAATLKFPQSGDQSLAPHPSFWEPDTTANTPP